MASWSSIVLGSSLVALGTLAGCSARAGLPSYAVVPDFQLIDQSGAAFDSAAKLDKHVWVADFIYTSCAGPCPRMSSQMHSVAKALAGADVRFVSFTVDPKNDSPPVLKEYASHFEADPARWFFLTGPEDRLQFLSRKVFMLGDTGGNLEHSTRFCLIDRESRVRGYYLTEEADAIPRLIADARMLAK
ncbi:MAG: SCO family protein [Acidobacteriia bacterium]|nr:SCO family protein [Terriglobia bacterium]